MLTRALAVVLCAALLGGCGADECEPGDTKELVCEDETIEVRCRADGTWRVAICSTGVTADGAGKEPADLKYDPKKSKAVLDQTTGLIWQRLIEQKRRTWLEGVDYCAALEVNDLLLGQLSEWRLPSRDELETLVLSSTTDPAIDDTAFPDTPSAPFWTKTKFNDKQGIGVDFETGGTGYQFFGEKFYVRCVH